MYGCLFFSFRLCSDIFKISYAIEVHGFNPDTHKPTETTEELIAKLDRVIENTRRRQREIRTKADVDIPKSIQSIRNDLNSWLERSERNTTEEIFETFKNLEEGRLLVPRYVKAEKATLYRMLINMNNKATDLNFAFIRMKQNQVTISKAMHTVKDARLFMMANDIRFNPDLSFLSGLSELGESVAYSEQTSRLCDVQSEEIFPCRLTNELNCTIVGICQMLDGTIILSDWANSKIKLFDEKFDLLAVSKTPEFPHGVCHISGPQFAVAICSGETMEIHFMRVSASGNKPELTLDKTIALAHECIGVVHKNDSLFVSSFTSIYEYALNGELQKLIYEDLTHTVTISSFALSGNHLYVTNPNGDLTTVDRKESVVYSNTRNDVCFPTGICEAENDNMFVCCKLSFNVHIVDKKGKILPNVNIKPERMGGPESIWYDKKTSRVIVGQKDLRVLQLARQGLDQEQLDKNK